MNKFVRFYNQNKEQLFITIIIIVMIITVIQILNGFAKKDNEKKNVVNSQEVVSKQEQKIEDSKQSVISENKVDEDEFKTESRVIDSFIKYCNNGKVEQAYNLLTDECKQNLYPTINDFSNNYVSRIFKSYKTYSIQNYYNNTYMIRITEDMLSTGKSNNGVAYQDYFTIENNKLNINEYLGRQTINTSGESNNIKISVLYKDVFMDYEKYTIEVYNGNGKNIKLDSLESTKSIYVENSKQVQFPSYSHELIDSLLVIPQGGTRKLEVKFYNKFISTNQVERMTFSDIILDYDQYTSLNDKTKYINRGTCTVEI